jgi:hypothetical protein
MNKETKGWVCCQVVTPKSTYLHDANQRDHEGPGTPFGGCRAYKILTLRVVNLWSVDARLLQNIKVIMDR